MDLKNVKLDYEKEILSMTEEKKDIETSIINEENYDKKLEKM